MVADEDKIPERYSISKATAEDVEQIRQLIHDTWIQTVSETLCLPRERLEEHLSGMMSEETLARWRESLLHPPEGRATLVAKDGARVLGLITIRQRANDRGDNELVSFHILQGYMGHGIGRSLWQAARGSLDPAHDTFLWTTAGSAAVDIYKRFGFEESEYRNEKLKTAEPTFRPLVKMILKTKRQ